MEAEPRGTCLRPHVTDGKAEALRGPAVSMASPPRPQEAPLALSFPRPRLQ